MKLYSVEAVFRGRVILKTRANSRAEATKIFEMDANEDECEIIKEDMCEPDWGTMKEYP